MNNTLNSNLGNTISQVKPVSVEREVEADRKLDDAIKLKEA